MNTPNQLTSPAEKAAERIRKMYAERVFDESIAEEIVFLEDTINEALTKEREQHAKVLERHGRMAALIAFEIDRSDEWLWEQLIKYGLRDKDADAVFSIITEAALRYKDTSSAAQYNATHREGEGNV